MGVSHLPKLPHGGGAFGEDASIQVVGDTALGKRHEGRHPGGRGRWREGVDVEYRRMLGEAVYPRV